MIAESKNKERDAALLPQQTGTLLRHTEDTAP